jgi:DNA-binding HxlR family transcriptional regulator
MANSGRIYPHFCMAARALEEIGERWSLLLVRDLMLGPRRFTDLARSLGGITPTRLTERLRRLEAMGIIVREPQSTGREVWYSLTQAGEDLRPVIEGLVLWGMEHAFEPPRPDEPIHPDHVMLATRMWLHRHRVRPRSPVVWAWQFRNGYEYTLRFVDDVWTLTRGADDAARVRVVAPADAWARFITDRSSERALSNEGIELVGTGAATKAFAGAFTG